MDVQMESTQEGGSSHDSVTSTKTGKPPATNAVSMNLLGAVTMVLGNIIGSGIFATVSGTTKAAPNSIGLSLMLWLVGGLVALCGSMSFAELSLYFKKSGGEQVFMSEAFGPQFGIAFLYGYNVLVVPMSITYGAMTSGRYIYATVFPDCPIDVTISRLLGASIIILLFFINVMSPIVAGKINVVFTVCKSIGLAIIIITGIVFLFKGGAKNFENAFDMTDFEPLELSSAVASSFWAYEGWNTLGHIAGEIKKPNKNLPAAFISGVGIVTVLYMLAVISYTSVLGVEGIRTSEAAAVTFATLTIGRYAPIISAFIVMSTTGLVNGFLYTSARITMVAGYEGDIPYMFGLVHRDTRSPVVALFIQALLSLFFIPTDVDSLIDYSSFISWMFYFLSMVALFVFKFSPKFKHKTTKFKAPVILQLVVMLASLFIIIMTFISDWDKCVIILAYLLVAFAVHYLPKKFIHNKCMRRFLGKIAYGLKVGYNMEMANLADVSHQ